LAFGNEHWNSVEAKAHGARPALGYLKKPLEITSGTQLTIRRFQRRKYCRRGTVRTAAHLDLPPAKLTWTDNRTFLNSGCGVRKYFQPE
jgi:hypothetical protein